MRVIGSQPYIRLLRPIRYCLLNKTFRNAGFLHFGQVGSDLTPNIGRIATLFADNLTAR